ncbi:MAG: acyltransferase [Pseudomonadota bacterium]
MGFSGNTDTSPMPVSGRAADTAVARQHRSMPLDSIRTVAILAVLIYHVASRYPTADLDPVAYVFRRYGLLGVDVFFPLSGYLITSFLIRRSGTEDIKVFFARRFFRIVPLYFAAVTIFLLIVWALDLKGENTGLIWQTYLFLTGWFIFFEGTEAVPYTITWSLSVEEFAYILFGLAAWLMRRNFLAFLIVLSVGAMALRIYLNLNGYAAVYNFPPARLDSIAIGGIVAFMAHRGARGMMPVLAALSLATYLIALLMPELWSSLKYTFIAFATCFVIVLFETHLRNARNLPLSWFSAIGFYSYFIYLFHMFNIEFLMVVSERFYGDADPPFWAVVLAALAMTHVQAVISFRYFEGPVMRFGRSLERNARHPNLA